MERKYHYYYYYYSSLLEDSFDSGTLWYITEKLFESMMEVGKNGSHSSPVDRKLRVYFLFFFIGILQNW